MSLQTNEEHPEKCVGYLAISTIGFYVAAAITLLYMYRHQIRALIEWLKVVGW